MISLARVVVATGAMMVACRSSPRWPERDASYRLDGLTITGAPGLDPHLADELAPYAVPSARLLDVADDGHRALITRGGELWEVFDGARSPIRHMAGLAVAWGRFAADGEILATADRHGDEVFELYREPDTASPPVQMGQGQHGSVVVEPTRGRLAWAASGRGDLEVVWEGSLTTHDVAARTEPVADAAWAPLDIAGDTILAKRVRSSWRADLVLLRGGVATTLDDRGNATAAVLSRRDDGVAYAILDRGGEHLGIWRIDLTGAHEPVALTADLAWDVTALALSGDGRTLAFVSNEDARSVLHLLDVDTGRHRVAPGVSTTGVLADLHFAARSNVLGLSSGDASHARDAYRYDLDRGELRAWQSRGSADGRALVEPQRVRIASTRGVAVPAFVYRRFRSMPARAPVVVKLHGGPEDQWLPRHDGYDQFLVARGWTIVEPDVRGSTGYGTGYAHLDDVDRRASVLDDIGAVLDWIARQPDLDASHVVVAGTSYGGYLAMMATIRFADRLRGAIVLGGIASLPQFLANTDGVRRAERRAEYGDERRQRALLDELSPTAHVGELRRPLLIAHGRRDRRVPIGATEEMVAALRGRGTNLWYVRADDEGHVFSRSSNRGVLQVLETQFLDRLRYEP